jgi:uncharacterized protein (DUF58 family)
MAEQTSADDEENLTRLARRATLLRLSSAALAENMRSGGFKSLYRGYGIEFSGVRDYFVGDDIRSIDWNVTARMNRPFVKQFEEERELQVFFVIDRSLSMDTGSLRKTRLASAAEAAALLLFAAEKNNSPVGAVFFDGEIQFSCAPKAGKERTMLILSRLERIEKKTVRGSVLGSALKGAGKLLKKRSLVFVISDFRVAGWEHSFAQLAQKNDVVAIRITDRLDGELPAIGSVSFSDPETGALRVLPTSSRSFARAWFDDNRRRTDHWKEECFHRGGYPVELSTAEEPLIVLSRFFAQRERS